MSRQGEIGRIAAILGGRMFTTRELGPYMAFASPIQGDGQIEAMRQVRVLTSLLERHCPEWHARGYTVFLGYPSDREGQILFAVPGADPIQLMDLFDVGSYNDFTGDTPARAKGYMASLFETDPFVPYQVDAANFKVRFINPVSPARAADIARAVGEFDRDAYEFATAPADVDAAQPDLDQSPIDLLARRIQETGILGLWWD
jgi:hypothetical protein